MKRPIVVLVALSSLLVGCKNTSSSGEPVLPSGGTNFTPKVTEKTLSKDTYFNKTLGGLLGQFAGFLSGYEFARWNNMTGLDESWFDFINGPYAGNYTYFTPPDPDRYDRLKVNPETGLSEVWSDDDYHIDIFNQYILKELGFSSFAIKETWKKYSVSDWGGGSDAMALINSNGMLSPFTGSIESGNRYGWCTEAYIENETLGMNAPGMPNVATLLTDKFASNVGYFDSVTWAKFYAAMYSFAYFEDDIRVVLEKAKDALPLNSYPYKIYNQAFDIYEQYPNDYKSGAHAMEDLRRNLYRIDNIQTDPNINGGLAILSFLYGENDYMKTAKYSSIMGYDGDCTAAICLGVMGILKGFKEDSEEYQKLNDLLYHNGEGVYRNDTETSYQAKILGSSYPTIQKIDDIVKMYQDNFEQILAMNGGKVHEQSYTIPTTDLIEQHSVLFTNYDAEERNTSGFTNKNASFNCLTETENGNSHTGFAYFKLTNDDNGEVYHTYSLAKGKTYRLTTYVKTSPGAQVSLFARGGGNTSSEISFANVNSLISKSLVFTATDKDIEVGFSFKNGASGDYLIFDDFMLEEINTPLIANVVTQELSLTNGKYVKTLAKPNDVKVGEEVLLCIEYRNYSGKAVLPTVTRNNGEYGGFVMSNTSKNSTVGSDIVEIPYVFEKDADAIQILYPNNKMYIGDIQIKQVGQYCFR